MSGYILSWYYVRKNNYRNALIFLVLSGLILRIYCASDFFLHNWDERYHALVAKNFMKHPLLPTLYDNPILPYDYKNWIANHIWVHKPPLTMWFMAASMKIFGINEFALRLPSIIISTLGILLTYAIARYFFDNKIGYISAFFFSVNGLIIELTGGRVATDHIDVFLMFFIILSIWLAIIYSKKKKNIFIIFAGISTGFALLSKEYPALITIPIIYLILKDNENFNNREIIKSIFIFSITFLSIFLPWKIYIHLRFPIESQYESMRNFLHFTQTLEISPQPWYFFIKQIRINYGELIYIPILWFLWKFKKDILNYKSLALAVWIFVPIIIFSFAKSKMQAYILFISPALFIITAEFMQFLKYSALRNKYKILSYILLFLFISLPIRYMIERTKLFYNYDKKPAWVKEIKKLNNINVNNAVLFNYDKPIEAMFYTNFIVYSEIPDTVIIKNLIDKNFYIIINDNGKIDESLRKMKGVQIEKLSSE